AAGALRRRLAPAPLSPPPGGSVMSDTRTAFRTVATLIEREGSRIARGVSIGRTELCVVRRLWIPRAEPRVLRRPLIGRAEPRVSIARLPRSYASWSHR